jgi:DNA polymerase-3 subunit epsilon
VVAPRGFAVVDVEATGCSSRRHRVVEVAVVLLAPDGAPQGEFCTLVDPQGPLGPTHIHGIERGPFFESAGVPVFGRIAARLLRLLRGRVLVGHNVGCDRAFLAAEYARVGVAFPRVPEVCTMRMAALRDPAPATGLSLAACAEAAGVTGWVPHTALGDAWATARLFGHYTVGHPLGPQGHPYAAGLVDAAAAVRWPRMGESPAAAARWVGRLAAGRPAPGTGPYPAPNRNVPVCRLVPRGRDGAA